MPKILFSSSINEVMSTNLRERERESVWGGGGRVLLKSMVNLVTRKVPKLTGKAFRVPR